jgi:predicted nuclease of predicted toxin-antitoxin system
MRIFPGAWLPICGRIARWCFTFGTFSLDNSPDTSIWRYARQHGYGVITKDEDFLRPVLAEGFPPRVVAVQNAQVPVKELAAFLLARLPQIEVFLGEQVEFGFLQLRLP